MPKSVLKIDDFSGGLNEMTTSKDLQNNEFHRAEGVSFETPGVIKPIGHWDAVGSGQNGDICYPGNGLHIFQSDYRMLMTDNNIDHVVTYNGSGYEYWVAPLHTPSGGTARIGVIQIDMSDGTFVFAAGPYDGEPEPTTFSLSGFFANGGFRYSATNIEEADIHRQVLLFRTGQLFNGANSFPAYPDGAGTYTDAWTNYAFTVFGGDGRVIPQGVKTFENGDNTGSVYLKI